MSAREKLFHFLKRKGTESSEESSSIKEQRLQERESEEPVTLQENREVAHERKGIYGSTSGTSSASASKSRPILSRLRTALTSKFKEAKSSKSLDLQDIANLERLKNVIAGFELGVHCEIEQIADRRPLLSITPSKLKTFSDYVGLFHPVKLLLYADTTGQSENANDCVLRPP